MNIKFSISGQKISILERPTTISYTNELEAEFSFSNEWAGRQKTAIFKRTGIHAIPVLIENDKCIVPKEVLRNCSKFEVGVIAGNIHTTNIVEVYIDRTCYNEDAEIPDPTPSIYDQIIEKLESIIKGGGEGGIGPQGPQGPKGDDGKSAYQIAVDNGYVGTESEWLATLKGDKGADGTMTFADLTEEQKESLRGPQGIQGPKGDKGDAGEQGPKGADGKSAYESAVTGGYDGTEEDFEQLLANLGQGSYTLPTASETTLGGVKVDNNTITVDSEGVISSKQYTLPTASDTELGGVKVDGTTITIDDNGVISSNNTGSTSTTSKFKGSPNEIVHFKVKINTFTKTDIDSTSLTAIDSYSESEDCGILFLPPNYSISGKPVRLIIYCHGAMDSITDATTTRNQPCDSLVKLGYAVMDMNATGGSHYCNTRALQSYVKGYQYCIQNYNLYKEVFLSGLSMGGLMSLILGQNKVIPVIAQGLFCPVTDHYRQMWCKPWIGNQRKVIADLYDFVGSSTVTFTVDGDQNEEEKALYKDNVMKTMGYNPMAKNSNWYSINLYQDADDLDSIYNQLIKYYDVPLKIWHCEDDGTVEPYFSKKLVEAIRRGGGIAYYRGFVSGGHKAWESGENTTIKDYNDEDVTVKASCFELVNWFRRFENISPYEPSAGVDSEYTITKTLNNVTIDNEATTIKLGENYVANIEAKSGYVVNKVTVKMGSEDITNTAYSNGTITINNVGGDIVIIAVAKLECSTVVPSIFYDFTTGTADDLSGNGRNATMTSGFADENNGLINNEFAYNGDDGHYGGLVVQDFDLLSSNESIAVEMVIKTEGQNISTMICGNSEGLKSNEDTKFKIGLRGTTILCETKKFNKNSDTVNVNITSVKDNYNHIVYTYDVTTDTKRVYLNGNLIQESVVADDENKKMPLDATFSKLYIGCPYNYGGNYTPYGKYSIRMFKYYSGHEFTAEEVKALFNDSTSYLS